jgi:hypothetical protein
MTARLAASRKHKCGALEFVAFLANLNRNAGKDTA